MLAGSPAVGRAWVRTERAGWILALSLFLWLGGCGSLQKGAKPSLKGVDFASIPDAVPRAEPRSRYGNPPSYEVFGQRYYTLNSGRGYVACGVASWYGPDFQGLRTSSGDTYDMYGMTAAHKTLPLPAYARVTNLENGRSVVVRINDRGPFHDDRIIDMSYVAAGKLGMLGRGTAMVEVKALEPGQPEQSPVIRMAEAPVLDVPRVEVSSPATPTPAAPPRAAPSRVQPPPAARTSAAVPADVVRIRTAPNLYVQVGAFGNRDNAERLREQIVATIPHQVRIQPSETASPVLYRVQVGPLTDAELVSTVSQRLASLGVNQTRVIVE